MPDPRWPALPLPELKPGEHPPDKCVHCGASHRFERETRDYLASWRYECGATYARHGGWDIYPIHWMPMSCLCSRPSASAVLRAILAGLTPEQRERVAVADVTFVGRPVNDENFSAGYCIEAAATALEKHDA